MTIMYRVDIVYAIGSEPKGKTFTADSLVTALIKVSNFQGRLIDHYGLGGTRINSITITHDPNSTHDPNNGKGE